MSLARWGRWRVSQNQDLGSGFVLIKGCVPLLKIKGTRALTAIDSSSLGGYANKKNKVLERAGKGILTECITVMFNVN